MPEILAGIPYEHFQPVVLDRIRDDPGGVRLLANMPMRDTLLWVYEGQTQYWGDVLAARSGLWTKQQALDEMALCGKSRTRAS